MSLKERKAQIVAGINAATMSEKLDAEIEAGLKEADANQFLTRAKALSSMEAAIKRGIEKRRQK